MAPIVGLMLAAGSSRRFGSDKLLQTLLNNEPIIITSVKKLAAVVDQTIVLIRPHQSELRSILTQLNVEIIEFENANEGMGVTLSAGIKATSQAAGWLVALGDMPCLKQDTIRMITKALREQVSIVAPYHAGERGHPVGFNKIWFKQLAALTDDMGARDLLQKHYASITRIDVSDPGCLIDVDTQADLEAIKIKGKSLLFGLL